MEIKPESTSSRVRPRSQEQRRTRTLASVFIIESVTFDDERDGRLEGDILSQILQLSGKTSAYVYIRTKAELEAVLEEFARSKMRYLHISCHGNEHSLFTTLDEIPFAEFARVLRPHLDGRRLFISACEAVNPDLAEQVMPQSGCYSIVGPARDVGFDEAAVMWAAFYHLIFKQNTQAMKGADIRSVLTRLITTFGTPMTYIRESQSAPFWRKVTLSSRNK